MREGERLERMIQVEQKERNVLIREADLLEVFSCLWLADAGKTCSGVHP